MLRLILGISIFLWITSLSAEICNPSPVAATGVNTASKYNNMLYPNSAYYIHDDTYYKYGKVAKKTPSIHHYDSNIVVDELTGLLWTIDANVNDEDVTASRALFMCRLITTQGYNWRLPNVRELQTLIDYSKEPGNMFRDATAFIDMDYSYSVYYWSSTPKASSPADYGDYYWYVDFIQGITAYSHESEKRRVICVTDNKTDCKMNQSTIIVW